MGRPVGSGVQVGLPVCSKPGHDGSRDTLYDRYGPKEARRQRYRCYPADGSKPHTFAGSLARLLVESGACVACENEVAVHQGPRVVRRYEYPVRAIAEALVAVGAGTSYSAASDRARAMAGQPLLGSQGSQLVGNWVEMFAPVVARRHAVTEWPETIVMDSTTWRGWTKAGPNHELFHVQVVAGYETDAASPKVYKLVATPQLSRTEWVKLLRSVPGTPKLAVTDEDGSLRLALAAAMPDTTHRFCEFHMRRNLYKHMKLDSIEPALPAMPRHTHDEAAHTLFWSFNHWVWFRVLVGDREHTNRWLDKHEPALLPQLMDRTRLPEHYSNRAAERAIQSVEKLIGDRAFCFRNTARTNHLLELHRLHINLVDDVAAYASDIRTHLDRYGGLPLRQGRIRDLAGHPSLH